MGVDTETTTADETQKSENGSSGSDNGVGKTAFRAAALAAATGATAYAAKRMWSDRHESQSEGSQKPKPKGSGGGSDESLVGSMFSSGWDAARDSLLPVAEDAAASAGEFVGRSAPEVVRDRIVPRFISGFERGRESSEE